MVGHRCHLLRGLHHPVTPNFLIKTVLNKDSLATLGRKDYFGEKRLFWGTLKQEQIQPVVFFSLEVDAEGKTWLGKRLASLGDIFITSEIAFCKHFFFFFLFFPKRAVRTGCSSAVDLSSEAPSREENSPKLQRGHPGISRRFSGILGAPRKGAELP